MNDRIGLGPASRPFDSAGRHRTVGVCGRACDVVLQLLPVPNLAPTVAARIAASPVRSATGLQIALSRQGCQSPPVFRPRRVSPQPGRPRQRRRAGRTMVLSRKGRERALMRRRPGCPRSLSARGLSRNPEGARGVCMAEPRPTDLPGTAGVLAGIVDDGAPPRGRAPVGRRLSVEAPAFATAAGALRAGRRGRRRSQGKRAETGRHSRRAASPGYPGTPGTPPSRKPARTASRKSRNCESRNPGTAPARHSARLSRNARTAPVPGARTHRVPQIPQLRIPRSRIREPRRRAPLRPVIPERPDRSRPGRPPAPRPANPAIANPRSGSGRTPPVRFAAPRRERTAAFARPARRAGATANSAGTAPHRVRGGATASRRGRRVRWPRGCARRGRRAAGRPCGRRPTRRRRRTPGRRRARGIRG